MPKGKRLHDSEVERVTPRNLRSAHRPNAALSWSRQERKKLMKFVGPSTPLESALRRMADALEPRGGFKKEIAIFEEFAKVLPKRIEDFVEPYAGVKLVDRSKKMLSEFEKYKRIGRIWEMRGIAEKIILNKLQVFGYNALSRLLDEKLHWKQVEYIKAFVERVASFNQNAFTELTGFLRETIVELKSQATKAIAEDQYDVSTLIGKKIVALQRYFPQDWVGVAKALEKREAPVVVRLKIEPAKEAPSAEKVRELRELLHLSELSEEEALVTIQGSIDYKTRGDKEGVALVKSYLSRHFGEFVKGKSLTRADEVVIVKLMTRYILEEGVNPFIAFAQAFQERRAALERLGSEVDKLLLDNDLVIRSV